jgi:Flp pilus assembly protein TadD
MMHRANFMQAIAVVVLGMHRSGTSCLAGMLAAGGVATAGHAVRNWDNARGHHEMLDVVRLDEAVLAHSGGHWLSPPREVRWTDEHAAARDRILGARIDGRPALLKDPRMLLVLPFWRASAVPFHVIGIVRHPLAVARSLESWRETPLAEGVALWAAHDRVLADDHARRGYPLVDFEQPRAAVVAMVEAACQSLGLPFDAAALAAAYEEQLVHHDDADAPPVAGLDEAIALYLQLAARVTAPMGAASTRASPAFPRSELARFTQLARDGEVAAALEHARAAIAAIPDAAAVLVPVVTALVRQRGFAAARALITEHAARLDEGLGDLLQGKVLLAQGDAAAAIAHLEAARTVAHPFFQARHLLPQALRAAGRHAEARTAMQHVIAAALYPHGPLATLAEWSWADGARGDALAWMQQAIAAAPPHRRGRLRTRRAEWWIAVGDTEAARRELVQAIDEDPAYGRSRDVLARLA